MSTKSQIRFAWAILLLMSLVGVISVVGHYVFQPSVEQAIELGLGPSPAWYSEQLPRYNRHPVVTFLHLASGLMLMVLAPLQLSARIRQRYPWLHRISGRIFVGMSFLMVIAGTVIGFVMPFDGGLETWGSLFIATGFSVALVLGVRAIRRGDVDHHRVYMSYMLAFAYAPITMRFVLIALTQGFALDGQVIFAESMLLGVFTNLLLVTGWLRRRSHPVSTTEKGKMVYRAQLKTPV